VFPERGVVISVKPGTQTALAVLLEPLDPEPFVLRAEGEIDHASASAVADLQYAIEIDPRHVRAHRLLLALLSEQGRWQQALAIAEAAEKLDSVDIWTQLEHADVLQGTRPETGIEQVQDGMLHPADILAHRQPLRRHRRIERAIIGRAGEANEIPA
jgi:tetratricopeptide (TPR) repeat protein